MGQSNQNPLRLARRSMLIGSVWSAFVAGAAPLRARMPKSETLENELFYDYPAGTWNDANPIGNGRIGAMVFGRIKQERLQLNEDTLWSGGPHDPTHDGALPALAEVRRLIDSGQFSVATDLINKRMLASPPEEASYGSAGDVLIDWPEAAEASGYTRRLDLTRGTSEVRFDNGGMVHRRECFASAPDQVIVMHFDLAEGQHHEFAVRYRHPMAVDPGKAAYGAGDVLRINKANAAPWNLMESDEAQHRPATLFVGADGVDAMLVSGRNWSTSGLPAALRFAVRIKLTGQAVGEFSGDRFKISATGPVTLVIALATSFKAYDDVSGDPVILVRQQTEQAAQRGFAALRARHIADHSRHMDRFSIRLGAPRGEARATDTRIAAEMLERDPGLAALYVQFARYLMLGSSRPGSQPANLQGIWNAGTNPPWNSNYTININTQMNYWPVDSANLGECIEPLLRMVEDLAVTGSKVAQRMYGARGWVAHHNTDLWRNAAAVDGAGSGMWPTGGAWLCQNLWSHYLYRDDPALLRRLYPLLAGASQFFVDSMVEDPKGRGLVTSPSISPENAHAPSIRICAGPAMDRQIIRDLFDNFLAAHARLDEPENDLLASVKFARKRIPSDRIGEQGQLQEWLEDWDGRAPEPRHRHVSHLYAVYPSEQINLRDTPDLAAAARVTLNQRGDIATGWGTAWRIALWARLGDGERAYSVLKGLLGPGRTYPNMFDSHPPFQIDGNFGGGAAIIEMLVQCWGGAVHLLPALPKAWPNGQIRGVRAHGNLELDLEWRDAELSTLMIRGRPGQKVSVAHPRFSTPVTLNASGRYRFIA